MIIYIYWLCDDFQIIKRILLDKSLICDIILHEDIVPANSMILCPTERIRDSLIGGPIT